MTFLVRIIKRITRNRDTDQSSGKFETSFFEYIYRIVYITGLSVSEPGLGYWVYSWIVWCLKVLLVCFELWYPLSITWSMEAITDSMIVLTIQFSYFYKYRNLISHRETFKMLASSMQSPNFDISTNTRKNIVDIWIKRNRSNVVILLVLGTCTLTAWYIYPLMDDIEYNLMVAMYLPFDYSNNSMYPIVYVTIIIMFTYMSYSVMTTDILMLTYLMQLLCQFVVLKDCFGNILNECSKDFKGLIETQMFKDERFRKKYTERLRQLINQHRFILNNTLELRAKLSGPLLGHLSMSTVMICSIGLQFVLSMSVNVTKCVMSLIYLGYNMAIIYALCLRCEEITIQNEGIGTALYCSGWERGLATIPGLRSSILLILTRANKPLVLTAGGMYDLSLASFANLVKTSYSALTVLLRFRY